MRGSLPPDDSKVAYSPPRWERRERRRICLRRRPPILPHELPPLRDLRRRPPISSRLCPLRSAPWLPPVMFPGRGTPHSPPVLVHSALPAPAPLTSPRIEPPNPYPPPRRLLRRFLRVCFLLRCIYLYLGEILLREQRRPCIVILVLDALEPKDLAHRR
jgi:hypothetical protein